ncbi:MAG TPA: RDD family protein [Thermoleophilaceae bacterium]|nr:RDD family protein [Thermoleophilaceae bacterium]
MNAIAQASAVPATGPKLDNRRVVAGIVDLLIVGLGGIVILVAGDALTGERQGGLTTVILGWALYYYFALESGNGQTVGKKLMKLRVMRADGRPAGMREIAVRTVLRVVDGLGAYIVGLIVMLVTGQRRQRIGDLAANTIVVDASTPTSAPPQPAAAAEADDDAGDEETDEPVEDEPEYTSTITLPTRAAPPTTLVDLTGPEPPVERDELDADEPVAEAREDEPVAEAEPVADVPEAEPVAEAEPVEDVPVAEIEDAPVVEDAPVIEIAEPVAEDAPVIEIAAAPDQDAPVAGLSVVPPEAQVYELSPPVVEEEPVEEAQVLEFAPIGEPQADDDELADLTSPSLEALARDVAAAHAEAEDDGSDDDAEPITLRSVETVSAMDLIMGAADEDNPSDDAPASA